LVVGALTLSLLSYSLVDWAASSSPHRVRPPSTAARPPTHAVPLGTTEAITVLGPGGGAQVPATLRISDVIFPATGRPGADATAVARVCAGPLAVDPLSGVSDVQMVDSRGHELGLAGSVPLPATFFSGRLAPRACLSATLAYELPAGSRPRSLTLFSSDRKTVNWSAS
jgi:hypothetical protein